MPNRKTAQPRIILCIFPHYNFIKNTITFDVSNGVNVRFVSRTLCVHRAFKILQQCHDLQSEHWVLLNLGVGWVGTSMKQIPPHSQSSLSDPSHPIQYNRKLRCTPNLLATSAAATIEGTSKASREQWGGGIDQHPQLLRDFKCFPRTMTLMGLGFKPKLGWAPLMATSLQG